MYCTQREREAESLCVTEKSSFYFIFLLQHIRAWTEFFTEVYGFVTNEKHITLLFHFRELTVKQTFIIHLIVIASRGNQRRVHIVLV